MSARPAVSLAAAALVGLPGLLRAADPPLAAGPAGSVQREGRPFRAVGINYFDAFLRLLKDPDDASGADGFRTLAEHGVPFARFCATGFWPAEMQLYRTNRVEYFRRLDLVVAAAERHRVGLVPSLFWHVACVPDLVGEPVDQWGEPASRTHAWMREYVSNVVTRYRGSPAVWAWEFGNEYSLQADLPNAAQHRPPVHPGLGTPAARTARDELTHARVRIAFAAFGRAVRAHDPARLILTGDSFPRLSAWHQEQERTWTHDTKEQFQAMLERANPDPISALSLHAYEDDDQRFGWAMEVSRRRGHPLFIGEFGAQGNTPDQAAKFHRLLNALTTNDVPLAAVWVFDLKNQPDFTITPGSPRAYQLEAIGAWNRTHGRP